MTKQADKLLRRREVAEMLGVREETLSLWSTSGRGPRCIRLTPKAIRYRQSDVERFLREKTLVTN